MKQTKLRESVERYAYRVIWSEEDQEFVGLCAEMPSLSWLAPTQAAALAGIVNLAGKVVADLRKAADPIPEPLALRSYSGEFRVRIPPLLHRRLALEAADAQISLNRLREREARCVSAKLAA